MRVGVIKLHSTNWFQFFVDNLHNVVSSALLSQAQTEASRRVKGGGALVPLKKKVKCFGALSSASAHLQIKASTSPQGPHLPLSLRPRPLTDSQTKTKMSGVGHEWLRFASP